MFGIKKKEKSEDQPMDAHINTIPEIFYGGHDPLVYRTPSASQRVEAPHPSSSPPNPIGTPRERGMQGHPLLPEQHPSSHGASSSGVSSSLFSKKWLWISV